LQLVDEGATLDAEFYDAYISSLVGARKFRRAHQIYFHMSKRQKLPATATTYKNLITIYGESKRWDLVQECSPPLILAAPSFVTAALRAVLPRTDARTLSPQHCHFSVLRKMASRNVLTEAVHYSAAVLAVAKVS
jgi:hypothetical protein